MAAPARTRPAEEIEAARTARAEKVEALNEQLAEAVERLATSQGWVAMLAVASDNLLSPCDTKATLPPDTPYRSGRDAKSTVPRRDQRPQDHTLFRRSESKETKR